MRGAPCEAPSLPTRKSHISLAWVLPRFPGLELPVNPAQAP